MVCNFVGHQQCAQGRVGRRLMFFFVFFQYVFFPLTCTSYHSNFEFVIIISRGHHKVKGGVSFVNLFLDKSNSKAFLNQAQIIINRLTGMTWRNFIKDENINNLAC